MSLFRIFVSETIERTYSRLVEAASQAEADAVARVALEIDADMTAWTIETRTTDSETRAELTQRVDPAPVVPIALVPRARDEPDA